VRDYERFIGRKAKIKLRESVDGEKVYVGEIQSVQGESVELVVKDKGVVNLPFEHIRKARLAL